MLSESDIDEIRALHCEWMRRELAGETVSLIELCTDDVVLMPPGGRTIAGREDVGRWLGQPGPEVLAVAADIRLLRGNGATAYKLADFTSSFRDVASGETVVVSGSHLWIMEKSAMSPWRVALLTWTVFG